MRSDNNNNFGGTNHLRRRHKNDVAEICHVFTQDYLVASKNDTHNVTNFKISAYVN